MFDLLQLPCRVLTHMDTKGLAKCFDDNTKDCSIDPVGEKMVGVPKVPPGLINMSFSSLPTLEHALCNYGKFMHFLLSNQALNSRIST